MSFSKRPGSDAVCYTKPLDSLKNWNDHFFWVDAFAFPASFPWNTSKGVPKDPFLKSSEFNAEHFATLVTLPAPFHKYSEPFLCLVGISHYYTLDEDAYLEFLGDNDEASVDKLFDEGASGDVQGADIQPVDVTTDTIVDDVDPLQPKRERKRKTIVADADGPSHPPKKLREDYGALGGASTTATPEREDKIPADSVTGLNLQTIGAPQRSSALTIAAVTTVTAAIDADAMATRAPVTPSLFGVGSSSTGRTDYVPGGFSDVSGSDFLIGGIRTVVDPDSDLQKVYAELLKVKDGEIESLKAQLLLKEAKATEAIRFWAEVFKFEVAKQSFWGEMGVLRDQRAALEREKNELSVKVTYLSASVKVHELEISSAGLQEKVVAYEDFVGQLEKFQDEKLEEVNEKFDKLCVDFVDMALHLEEKFYPHLLTTISRRRWLLTYGMKLAEGLSVGITYGAEGRKLADVAAYNPSAKADYLSALQHLQNVNFSLIVELQSNKDAIVDTIMNLLRLDDVLVEMLGLTESQPHVNQLMVPIHHSLDQRVVGAFTLSLFLEVSHSWVKKMRENIAKHVSALRGVFVPLSEPLYAAALEGMEGTSDFTHDATTTLSTTFVSASTIQPIFTDDYEVSHADGQGVPV
nr:hypothetical protein [Tanacetum cinerariifolium]